MDEKVRPSSVQMCGEGLVDFLAAQSECVQQVSADGARVLREEREDLPVKECQQGLVAGRPHPVPRPVEGVGHGRAQHVVQVDLGHLERGQNRLSVCSYKIRKIG